MFFITTHAVEQLIARVMPHATHHQAESALSRGLKSSARMRNKTAKGQAQYLLANPRCIAVVSEERGKRIVVTVLGFENGRATGERAVARQRDAYVPHEDQEWEALRVEVSREVEAYLMKLAARRLGGVFGRLAA